MMLAGTRVAGREGARAVQADFIGPIIPLVNQLVHSKLDSQRSKLREYLLFLSGVRAINEAEAGRDRLFENLSVMRIVKVHDCTRASRKVVDCDRCEVCWCNSAKRG